MSEIEIEIDGQLVKANQGDSIINIADREGIEVPRFCYHKKLSVAANCRMCLVDVEGVPKAQPACSTPAANGMKINTKNMTYLSITPILVKLNFRSHTVLYP